MRQNTTLHYHITHNTPTYPNQADNNYYLKKLTDIIAGLVAGFGLTVSIIFLARIM